MKTSVRQSVAALGQTISQRIGEPRYRLWFEGKTKFRCTDETLEVGVPNRFYQEWLQKTFADEVRAAAADLLGQSMQVRFAIDPELFQAARQAESLSAPLSASAEDRASGARPGPGTEQSPRQAAGPRPRRLRRWHGLGDFVVSACNRLAHAAALSVVESACHANPLVLHGPVGTGKTHLLEGICAGLQQAHSDWTIRFVSSEEFTNRFLHAMKGGQLAPFRKQFRDCDALLVDDLHFLARKKATQEEFLHTFDALLAEGKQVVLTCDCHPRLTEEFSPELTDRLLGGPVWGLTPPDAAGRLAILRAKAGRGHPFVPEEVLELLAELLRGNVRELEGALHSVRHYSVVAGKAVDLQLARESLGDLLRHAVRVVGLGDIEEHVSSVLRLDKRALKSKERAWAVSHPRMLAMYLARKHTGATFNEIGRYFGNRNHSTVAAAQKKVRHWLETDGEMLLSERRLRVREVVEKIERELQR